MKISLSPLEDNSFDPLSFSKGEARVRVESVGNRPLTSILCPQKGRGGRSHGDQKFSTAA
jgi:hypothetical protein